MNRQSSNQPLNFSNDKKFKGKQSGQVLLIVVMILTTILAVTFSLSFTSQTETQTSKLEEESKRSLAAAESLLEASLKKPVGSYNIGTGVNGLNLTDLTNQGFSGSATVTTTASLYKNIFTTPFLQTDEQYTFYTSDYPGFGNLFNGNIYLYLGSESGCPAVEITYIHNDNSITRDLVDPCTPPQVTKNSGTSLTTVGGSSLNRINFQYQTQSPIALANYKVVIFRALFNPTRLGMKEVNGIALPSQGNVTSAQAQSSSTVTTSVDLFQSYPQIPSDFFVTSF